MPTPRKKLGDLPPETAARRIAFGAAVRTERQRLGLSQVTFADRSGLDRKLVYRTELGTTAPTLDSMYAIADALGVSLHELLPDGQ